MRIICFLILLIGFKVSIAQKWTQLGNTSIDYYSLVDDTDTLVIYKKASAAIAVPATMSIDFQQLFLHDPYSFDTINDSCLHFRTFMVDTNVQSILSPYGIEGFVYFIKRDIKISEDKEIWSLTNLFGQGQPCWPGIILRRLKSHNASIEFIAVIKGLCEI